MMKSKWQQVQLGEIIKNRKESPDLNKVLSGKIPIVAKIRFRTGIIELRKKSNTKTNMILIKPGDLVLSGINADKGAIAIYKKENSTPAAATIHYSSYKINQDKTNPKYLWYFLRSKDFRRILLRSFPNGIKSEVKPQHLLPLNIPLPPIEAQDCIVKKIEKIKKKVVDVQNLQMDCSQEIPIIIPHLIDDIFNNFQKILFSEIVIFKPRSGPSFRTDPNWNGTPVLMPSSVSGFGINTTKTEFGIGTEIINTKDFLEEGDIIIARGNKPMQVGNAGVVPKVAHGWVCANLLMRLKVDRNKVNPHFCIYWLRSTFMRNYVNKKMKGTSPSIQKINQKIILNFPFPLPSLSIQHKIVHYLDFLQKKVNELQSIQLETQKEIQDLVPSVLDRAFTGAL